LPCVLGCLRLLIPSLEGQYDRLDKASAAQWGQTLGRYRAFQRLRRRPGESEAEHRARQAHWLCTRRAWERENRDWYDGDIRAAWPHDSADSAGIALGTWIASAEQIAGSELEDIVPIFPTGRVLVFDLASDKELLIERISELIDRERKAAGIASSPRRGPLTLAQRKLAAIRRAWPELIDNARQQEGLEPGPPYPPIDWRPEPAKTEQREFLKAAKEHRIVPLWDMQIAGTAIHMLKTAQTLYPETLQKRSLLMKLHRAEELQQEALTWIPRLSAVIGQG
jgi:hypothetical protein